MSEIRATTISDAAGTGPITLTKQSAAKVWISQDSGTTINDSLNVSTIVDNGTGDYTNNFTSSMANVFYSSSGMLNTTGSSSTVLVHLLSGIAVSSDRTLATAGGTKYDFTDVHHAINGDLA